MCLIYSCSVSEVLLVIAQNSIDTADKNWYSTGAITPIFYMNKGFNPTPKQTPPIKNVTKELQRKTKELKRLMRHPLVVASQLDRSATLELDTSDVDVVG